MPPRHTPTTILQSFWSKVQKTEGCWLWIGAVLVDSGYGKFYDGEKTVLAHRFAYKLYHGKLAREEDVLHTCDITNCIREEHLFKGNQEANMKDMVSKGRHVPVPGEKCGTHKLTTEEVLEIKRALLAGTTQQELAERFDVCRQTVSCIAVGKSWKHVNAVGLLTTAPGTPWGM